MTKDMLEILPDLARFSDKFYLGGGTALALQLGHRQSVDFDFFTQEEFEPNDIILRMGLERIIATHRNTIHCIHNNVRISFLYYDVSLEYPTLKWEGINIADIKDVVAEKFKTIAQRGARKDFCDLYSVFQNQLSIKEGCRLFLERFLETRINVYSVLKSLTYFIDANSDPDPIWLTQKYPTDWVSVKNFFRQNASLFKEYLIDN